LRRLNTSSPAPPTTPLLLHLHGRAKERRGEKWKGTGGAEAYMRCAGATAGGRGEAGGSGATASTRPSWPWSMQRISRDPPPKLGLAPGDNIGVATPVPSTSLSLHGRQQPLQRTARARH
jgi:hypothetical protein